MRSGGSVPRARMLTGIIATYVPWLLYPNRTIFQFYTIVILPFMILALTAALRDLAQLRTRRRFPLGRWCAGVFIVAVLVVSAWYYPVWTAMPVTYDFWHLHFQRDGWV